MNYFIAGLPEETLPLDSIVFSVVVEVHLDVARADVALVTGVRVYAMVMGLLLVVLAARELVGTVIHGGDPPEPVLEGLVHLLVPLAVSDHLLLLCENLAHEGRGLALAHIPEVVQGVVPLHLLLAHGHGAVKVLPVVHVLAVQAPALQAAAEALEVPRVVGGSLGGARQQAHSLGSQDVRWDGPGRAAGADLGQSSWYRWQDAVHWRLAEVVGQDVGTARGLD